VSVTIKPLIKNHWNSVSKIYAEGVATGLATFETEIPSWENWNKKQIPSCRLIASIQNEIVGYAVLSKFSERDVYKGVAEVSIYIAQNFRGQKIGETLLKQLIKESEDEGFWALQAVIFSKNIASINLHKNCGFRIIGIREKNGQLNGIWDDNHLMEKRSVIV